MRSLALTLVLTASGAVAAPQVPDSKAVTSITEAAKLCELSEAGIDWTEASPTVIQVMARVEDFTPESPKLNRLKECFFSWAYDRHVTVEFHNSAAK